MTEAGPEAIPSLERELATARAVQAATTEILGAMSASPGDVQPVFDVVTRNARVLAGAMGACTARLDGEILHLVAVNVAPGLASTAGAGLERFPRPLDEGALIARAILTRAPAEIPDIAADPDYDAGLRQALLEGGARSLLALPLLRGDQVLGGILLVRAESGEFDPELIAVLQGFATQAAIALENARLFEETRTALARQTATAEVLEIISGSLGDAAPVFEKILDGIEALIPGGIPAVLLIDEHQQIDLAACRGMPETIARAPFPCPVSETPTALAIAEKRVLHYPDVAAGAPPQMQSRLDAIGNHAIALAPMIFEGRGIGSIGVVRVPPKPFSDKELALLKTFSDQAAIAVQNARLIHETREALERQTATAGVLQVISSSLEDTAPVFEKIMDSCEQLLNVSNIAVTLEDDQGQVRLVAFRGPGSRQLDAGTIVEHSVSAVAMRERRPVHIPDATHSTAYASSAARTVFASGSSGSLLVVPLLWKDQGIGAICVGRMPAQPFSDKEIALLETFTDQAVIAIQNARLFKEIQDGLEQQTAIADILRVTTEASRDVAPILDVVASHAVRLCDAASASILLIEGEHLQHIASRGPRAEQAADVQPIPLDRESTSGIAVLERRVVEVADMQAEETAFPRGAAIARRLGHHSLVCAPLMREGEAFGALILRRMEVRPFDAREVAVIRTFADQAAIAIQSVRLFQATEQALEQQTATAEVLRAISSSVADAAPVFGKILDSCLRLFTTDQAGVYLVRDDMVHLEASRGVGFERIRHLWPRPRNALFGSPRHFASARALTDPHPLVTEALDIIDDWSLMSAPMIWEGRLVGAVAVTRQPPRPFTERERALLTTFADQAVIAIENARLFHEIEDKSRQLEAANQHKSEFLANMSHELRTPLNAVIGFSDVLIERMFGELNDRQEDYLKDIRASGRHLLSLINDILDLSKIEAGHMELDVEHFDLRSALDNSLTLIRERAERHGIALALEAADDLEDFRADPRKFKQVMLNLLSNAVKFTPDGGRITVRARMVGADLLEVAISDTGIGIAPEFLETIFEEFRQAGGSYTNKQEGTGLGLSLTRRIVELHGGTIGVESSPGAGATFTFTLPRQP